MKSTRTTRWILEGDEDEEYEMHGADEVKHIQTTDLETSILNLLPSFSAKSRLDLT